MPISQLSAESKEKIPSEIIFAKAGGEKIDLDMRFSIGKNNDLRQRISIVSGKPLSLVLKPEKPVKTIKGYIAYEQKKISEEQNPGVVDRFISFLGSIVFAAGNNERLTESKLVLGRFEYADTDADGIYIADIEAPVVDGEYEIITIMDYLDTELGSKEIKLIAVVDPEGYVFEKVGNKELRIPEAAVSLYRLNSEKEQYELWPAEEYRQENPQTTDITGKYSFLVPKGRYYLEAEAPGYSAYAGEPFDVKEGYGVHINIELKPLSKPLDLLSDWKAIAIIALSVALAVVIILVLYNFYLDRKRNKNRSN